MFVLMKQIGYFSKILLLRVIRPNLKDNFSFYLKIKNKRSNKDTSKNILKKNWNSGSAKTCTRGHAPWRKAGVSSSRFSDVPNTFVKKTTPSKKSNFHIQSQGFRVGIGISSHKTLYIRQPCLFPFYRPVRPATRLPCFLFPKTSLCLRCLHNIMVCFPSF